MIRFGRGRLALLTLCTNPHTQSLRGAKHIPDLKDLFGTEPLVRRIPNPAHKLANWNEHDSGGHFPAMEIHSN
jgi:hypothetical protein